MKLQLCESGIRNIRQIAKEFNKAWIYFHIDLDGVTSGIAMKEYLKQYGISTENVIPMQYGDVEYSIKKTPNDTLPVLVDFAHGKIFMKIHTDHHDTQISYDNTSNAFSKAKSNAGTISAQISSTDIFSKEDVKVIDMVDSAGYAEENIDIDELKNYIFNYNKGKTNIQNHLRFGMVVGKLLLAYKNKPDFLKQVVMESKPSLMSMFQVMRRIVKENGWAGMDELQKNSEWYAKNQEENKIPEGDIETITQLTNGQNTLVGNTIVQVGGGNTRRSGAYDRYTAFKLYPEAKYFVMIWDSIGMMQVSKNNWNKENRTEDSRKYINLGELVIKDIFDKKYSKILNEKIYDISLLAIKKTLESKIEKENIEDALGFDYNELKALFGDLPNVSNKQKAFIEKAMKMKPQELIPNENDSEKEKNYKNKVIKFLNDFTIPLPEIVMKTSGGHPGITNLSGFQFLTTQRRIFGALKGGRNPYAPLDPNWKPDPNKPKKEQVALTLLKSIACDVVKLLNKDEQLIDYWKNKKGEDPVQQIVFESVENEPYPVGYKFSTKQGGDLEITHITKTNDKKIYRVKSLEPVEVWISQGNNDNTSSKKMSDFNTFSVSKEWIDYHKTNEIKKPENNSEWLEESKKLNENENENENDNDFEFWRHREPLEADTETSFEYKGYYIKVENMEDDHFNVRIYKPNTDDLVDEFYTYEWSRIFDVIIEYERRHPANPNLDEPENDNPPKDDGEKGWEIDESYQQLNEDKEQEWEGDYTDIIGIDEKVTYNYKGYKIYTSASVAEYITDEDDIIVYYADVIGDEEEDDYNESFSDMNWMDLCHRVTKWIDEHPLNKKEPKPPLDDGNNWVDDLDETKASRFNKHLDDKDNSFATISAERNMPTINKREHQRALNHRRTRILEKLLKTWGLKGYIKTKGGFDEKGQPRVEINGNLSEEDSFFVPKITKEQAIRLGKLFNQDSIMFKEKGSRKIKEIRTNIKAGEEGIGNETGLVFIACQGRHNIGKDKTYYSRPKSSTIKFAFNPEDESNKDSSTPESNKEKL